MFVHKEEEEVLKTVIESYIGTDFGYLAGQDFPTRIDILRNTLSYVRNMTVETAEDAALRMSAVDFCDNFILTIINDQTNLAVPSKYREVYTIGTDRPWTNQDLIKEKNLNGYFLSKVTGGEHHFPFGEVGVDYPFLKYVSDTDFPLIREKDFSFAAVKEYIIQKSNKIDIMILPFASSAAVTAAAVYQQSRKDGKLVITNDTNRQNIKLNYEMPPHLVQPFFIAADVVTIPAKNLRDKLNADPQNRFPSFALPHSFANATGETIDVSPSDKENIILSVGRIDDDVKNIFSLVRAFEQAIELIPDWRLVLAGSISAQNAQILLNKFPKVRNKIEFTGELDKASLYNQYKRAKIHCMSTLCGVMPNVCAEAMAFGCYQILSDSIDGADELTRDGEFGVVYEQERYINHPVPFNYVYTEGYNGEAERNLANALVEAAHKLDYGFLKTFIPKSIHLQHSEFDYLNNARKLALLLFA